MSIMYLAGFNGGDKGGRGAGQNDGDQQLGGQRLGAHCSRCFFCPRMDLFSAQCVVKNVFLSWI